ncbi:unnamed protein product [Effrenium voratum]|nr:unnamed protein product [Effrenium voratum]
MALSSEQRGVAVGMGLSLLLTLTGLLPAAFGGLPFPLKDDMSSRLANALTWDLLVILPVLGTVARLAKFRFFSPADINAAASKSSSSAAGIMQAIIQNTLEQAVMAFGAHLVWAATMPIYSQAVVPVSACFFFSGRVMFASGYSKGAPARAVGFSITFQPTALMLFAMVAFHLYAALSGNGAQVAYGPAGALLLGSLGLLKLATLVAESAGAETSARELTAPLASG